MKPVLFLFLLLCYSSGAQSWRPNAGIHLGLLVGFGSHQNDFGLKLDSYAGNQYVQLNAGITYRFFLSNLGDRCRFSEWRTSFGGVIMWGKKKNPINMDWDGALHQTTSPYSIGYQYLIYHDPMGTSQSSGAWNIGIQRVDILFENDVFGGQGKDRFRTGAVVVSYRDSLQKASIGLLIWTGKHAIRNGLRNRNRECLMVTGI